VFAAARSLTAKVWDVTTGACIRTWRPHKSPVADAAVDASGGFVATAGADRMVKVWDLQGGFCTHSFAGHEGVVLKVLFHPKQMLLFSAGDDAQVRMWDLVTRSCVAKLDGHFSAVTALALSPDGWTLLSGGRDKVVCLWDLRTNSRVATVPVYEALEGLAVLPPGSAFPGASPAVTAATGRPVTLHFATAGERGQVRVWRSDTAQCVHTQRRGGLAAAGKKKGGSGSAAAAGDDEGPPPAGAEFVDLQLLPGGRGLMAATGDARLLFFAADAAAAAAAAGSSKQHVTPKSAAPAAGGGAAKQAASMVLFRQLVGNQDEVTDLVFLGAADAPDRLAVATNAAEVRLYDSAAGLSCVASCVGHRWVVVAGVGAVLG